MGSTGATSLGSISVDLIGSRALDKKLLRMGCLLVVLLCLCCCVKPVFSIGEWSGTEAVTLVPEIGRYGPLKTVGFGKLPEGPVKKVFVILKPKNVFPYAFWDHSPRCLECTGLPEKRKLVLDALALNYAVFVPESLVVADGDVEYSDWGAWPVENPDVQNVVAMISEWKELHGLENLPTVALGSSAGGFIISTLGLFPGFFDSIAIMVCRGQEEAFELATSQYPPVLFIHMPKDPQTAAFIANTRRIFATRGIATAEAKWYEHPLTPDWYSELVPGVDLRLSMKIVDHLRDEGWLDEENLLTSADYRGDWYVTFARWNLTPQVNHTGLMLDEAIYEETNVAYARHTTFARKNPDMFEWFEGAYSSQESSISSI